VSGIFLAGSYGVELLTGEGERLDRLELEQLRPALKRIKPEIEKLIRDKEGYFLEDKGWTLALHARYADRSEAREVMAAAKKLMSESLDGEIFRIQGGNKFLEIGPIAANKGQTIEYLLEELPWPGSLLVYLGDDERDEEAFKVIQDRGGIACRVGSDGKDTVADCSLASISEARDWLQSLLERLAIHEK
jgi:trehalose 6-phosphate phosphatase